MTNGIASAPNPQDKGLHPAGQIVAAFICLCLAMIVAGRQHPESPISLLRSGALRDLVHESPAGRQALVSSPYLMPLPGVAAIPFTPFLRHGSFQYACIYGLALLMAFAAPALASLLRRLRVPVSWLVSILLWTAAAYLYGNSIWSDLLACAAMIVIAIYFEFAQLSILRALSGVFWGLAMLAHPAGIIAVGCWFLFAVLQRVFSRSPERNAVRWIQGVSILYTAFVYLFLNWMIMGDALYSTRAFKMNARPFSKAPNSETLSKVFESEFDEYAPVVSGQWGYLIEPGLLDHQGHHYLDFHPNKLPIWEDRTPLLITPSAENPLYALNDIGDPRQSAEGSKEYLLLAERDGWRFFQLKSHYLPNAGIQSDPE